MSACFLVNDVICPDKARVKSRMVSDERMEA